MKGLTIKKNNVEKLKIGTENGLLLIMFHHIDNKRLRISTFRADVTEYETGDRYLYAREPLNLGDIYELTYKEFDVPSAPLELSRKGEKPLGRPTTKSLIEPEYQSVSVDYKGLETLKGFQLEFNGEVYRGGLHEGSGIFIDNKNGFLQVSFLASTEDGTSYRWFYSKILLGDSMKISFNEFPTRSFTDPVISTI